MTMTKLNIMRQSYLHFSKIYADYIILRKQLMRIKMEREFRRKLALEMGKVLAQYRVTVEELMKQLEEPKRHDRHR